MVKVRSVRTTSSRIVVELEKTKRVTKFKPSAKEKETHENCEGGYRPARQELR